MEFEITDKKSFNIEEELPSSSRGNEMKTESSFQRHVEEITTDIKSHIIDDEPNLTSTNEEKKRKRQEEREYKKVAEEEYNRELSEQRYKRLMHLLDKSQFYANLILGKKDISAKLPNSPNLQVKNNSSNKRKATKHKPNILKENSPPAKRPRRNVRPREESDLKDYVTDDNVGG